MYHNGNGDVGGAGDTLRFTLEVLSAYANSEVHSQRVLRSARALFQRVFPQPWVKYPLLSSLFLFPIIFFWDSEIGQVKGIYKMQNFDPSDPSKTHSILNPLPQEPMN